LSHFHIINGDEEFLQNSLALQIAKESLVDQIISYNQNEIDTYEKEIEFNSSLTRAFILNYPKQIPTIPSTSDLLIIISKKLTDERAVIHSIKSLKTYSYNNEVIKWILKTGETFNIDLSRVAGAIFLNHGNNLRKINSEITKLAVCTQGQVTPELARSLLCFSLELTPRFIIDAILEGNTNKAIIYYDRLQELNDETGWITAYLQRFILQQIQISELLKLNLKEEEIALKLNLHSYVVKLMLKNKKSPWSLESLHKSYQTLCKIDLDHKQGKTNSQFLLELEIIRLSEESRNV